MLFIFDMDGVLWRGTEPIPYAAAAVAALRRAGHDIRFLTNNSAPTRQKFIEKLGIMGIPAERGEIATSSALAARHFVNQGWEGSTVFAIGREGLREELVGVARCRLVNTDEEPADAVVVGVDWTFNYDTVCIAQQHLLGGAHFLCTNRDPTYPVEGGKLVPGAGAVVAAVEAAAGRPPLNVGKPSPFGIVLLAEEAGVPASEVMVVGDRLDTDIDAGLAAGARTLLVLTGVTTRAEADALPPDRRPEIVLSDLSALPVEWTLG